MRPSLTSRPILRPPMGNLEIIAIHTPKGELDRNKEFALTIPEMFNNKNYRGKIATYKHLSPCLTNNVFWENMWDKNRDIILTTSPLATSTMGALSDKLPLCELPTENGKIYIEGEFRGKTRFGGVTVDQLRKIGVDVEKPGVFFAMEKGYAIGDANSSGSSYTIHVKDMPPKKLKMLLHPFYGDFKNGQGQLRLADNALQIPLGVIANCSPNQNVLHFNYLKPGPAIPGVYGNLGFDRFLVNFGYADEDGHFRAAVIMQDLKKSVRNSIEKLLATSLNPDQLAIVKSLIKKAEND